MELFKWKSDNKPVFPNFVEKFFGKKVTGKFSDGDAVSTVPSANIANSEKKYEINLAVPGIDKKDLKIEVKDNYLIISSEKQYENEEKSHDWLRREYGYASFQRIFELPEGANPDAIKASLRNGVLSLTIDKKADYKENIRRIQIH